jgi:hypothetical protein
MKSFFRLIALSFALLAAGEASAAPLVACRDFLSDGSPFLTRFEFLNSRGDFRDASEIRVTVSKTNHGASLKSVSNTDTSQPDAAPADHFEILRVRTNGRSVSFELESGGALHLTFTGNFGEVEAGYTRPAGPEMLRVYEDCEFLDPEVGITGTTKK